MGVRTSAAAIVCAGLLLLAPRGVGAAGPGSACTVAADCDNGQCYDGICCDQACGGACRTCASGTCTAVVNGADSDSCGRVAVAVAYRDGPPSLDTQDHNNRYVDVHLSVERPAGGNDILTLRATADSNAGANKYVYWRFSNVTHLVAAGDMIEYDVMLAQASSGLGGIEIYNSDGSYWRDQPRWADQNGVRGHPATTLAPMAQTPSNGQDLSGYALHKWFHRRLPVPPAMVGKTIAYWTIVDEDDGVSTTTSFSVDNVVVTAATGTPTGSCDAAGQCRSTSGHSCRANGDCSSGVCADGVCCAQACGACGTCWTGLGATVDGTCAPALAGTATISCAPYLCDGMSQSCPTSCGGNGDCSTMCTNGTCSKLAIGQACGSDGACAAGHCVDGVCCDGVCGGDCSACNLPGSVGHCSAAPDGSDPRGVCAQMPAAAAACAATCKAGLCAYPDAATVCRAGQCTGPTTASTSGVCDGGGACVDHGAVDCGQYLCANGTCPTSCQLSTQCSGVQCVGGHCGTALVAAGGSCAADGQCASGHCVDHVCCTSACGGACERCDRLAAGASMPDGVCRPLDGEDPDHECSGEGTCAGSCVAGACRFGGADTRCDLCSGCDGAGHCSAALASGDDDACGAIACPSVECKTATSGPRCSAAGMCVAAGDPGYCAALADAPDGTACSGGICQGGRCAAAKGGGGCSIGAVGGSGGAGILLVLAALALGVRRRRGRSLALAFVALLAACGGNGGTPGNDAGSGAEPDLAGGVVGGGGDDLATHSAADLSPAPDLAPPPTEVLTQHNDVARTGVNDTERTLTTANVGVNSFGKLFSLPVDGNLYAQPLFAAGVVRSDGAHDLVIAATEHNSVYAFDAGGSAPAPPLWTVNLGPSVPSTQLGGGSCKDLTPEVGITATPVIDRKAGLVYVVAKTLEGTAFHFRLHALDLATGAEKLGGPVDVTATTAGSGAGSVGGVITFDAKLEHNRTALLLSNGVVYLAFASHCDFGNYHGWILGYDATTLAKVANLNLTPNGAQAGIWQSGGGLSVDGDGNIYAVTGNGTFDGVTATPQSFGDSVVKLHPSAAGLAVVDWFTPFNQDYLQQNDLDLGTDAPVVIPGTNLVTSGSKQGILYLLDRSNLGHYHAADDSQIVQSFVCGKGHIHGTPVFYRDGGGAHLYVMSEADHVNAYAFDGALFAPTPSSRSPQAAPEGMPGGFLSLSSNGGKPGTSIVWASHPYDADANQAIVSGIVRAFDARDLSVELWSSRMATTRDDIGNFAKFVSPTVVGGRVYMASFSGQLTIYGLLPPAAPLPTPWQQADVGSVGVAGLATFDAKTGTFVVRGAGTNIGGVADAMHFAWFAVTGDVDLSMRVDAQEPTGAGAQAGLMVRELVDPAAREAALVVSPNGTVSLITRAIGGAAAVVDTPAATVTLPLYLRLSRKGATVTGSFSADGVAWTQVASRSLPMDAVIDVGMVGNGASVLSTSTVSFDQMALH